MNLTGITEYDEVVIKHFVDSLAVNCVYSFKKQTGLWISVRERAFRAYR